MRYRRPMRTLIVMVCVMSVVAACSKVEEYRNKSKRTEAQVQLNKLAKDLKTAYIANAEFPKGKAATLPESTGAACCPDKCKVSTAWASDPVWSALDFSIDEPTLFRYSYDSDGKTFKATAVGDLDCDGTVITYTLTGTAKDGNPETRLEEPAPNAD